MSVRATGLWFISGTSACFLCFFLINLVSPYSNQHLCTWAAGLHVRSDHSEVILLPFCTLGISSHWCVIWGSLFTWSVSILGQSWWWNSTGVVTVMCRRKARGCRRCFRWACLASASTLPLDQYYKGQNSNLKGRIM